MPTTFRAWARVTRWTGSEKSRINVTHETFALLLVNTRVRSNCAASSAAALRSGLLDGELTDSKHAVAVRTPASAAIAFFGARRASKVAQLLNGNVGVDSDEDAVRIEAARTTRDQVMAGQVAPW